MSTDQESPKELRPPLGPKVAEMMMAEYSSSQESWKLLMGLRFGALAFTITMLSVVLAAYQGILTNMRQGGLGWISLCIVAVFGFLSTAILFFIEEQTRNMCGACLARGIEIEEAHNVENGHCNRLWNAPPLIAKAEHKWLIRITYWLVGIGWILLFVRAFLI